MSVQLPIDLYSTDQLSAVILELRDYIGTLHDSAARSRASRASSDATHVSALLLGVLHGASVSQGDLPASEELLKALEALRNKATTAHVILAALPNRTFKRQMTVWFRAEVDPTIFLTFAMRSDLGGGAIIQVGSQVYDFSFRQVLLANRSRISEIFASV